MKPAIQIQACSVGYGDSTVLRGIDLAIAEGEFVVLVGPSGCGKSTLLNTIAGFVEHTSGSLRIGDVDVAGLEPKDRNIGMVFQSYALYPHMTVEKNMAFALDVARVPKAESRKRVQDVAQLLQLTHLLARRPSELSGGQRQRVAIGRALVRDVAVYLLDEPLSNLDAQLRAELRVELKRLHQRLHKTMVYVTHDQVEAMTLADRLVVLHQGRIQQVGTPLDVFLRPANRFVASFIGSPAMNFIDGELAMADGELVLARNGTRLPLPRIEVATPVSVPREVTLGARPEHVLLSADPADAGGAPAQVSLVEPMGSQTLVRVLSDGIELSSLQPATTPMKVGDRLRLRIDAASCSLFDRASGVRL